MAVSLSETTPVLSPDGLFYWDGQAWRPAVSADGVWRFDGQSWQPTGYIPPWPGKPVREPTRWTRPLQAAVIGWQVLGLVIGLLFVVVVMPYFANQAFPQMRSENGGPNQAELDQMLTTMFWSALIFGLVFGGGLLVLLVIGTWKRWTWLFWTLTVLYLFGALGLVQNVVYLFSPPAAGIRLPVWFSAYEIVSGLIQTCLAVAMILAGTRIGPWACRRVA